MPLVWTTCPISTLSSWPTISRLSTPVPAAGSATPRTVVPRMLAETAVSGSRISRTVQALAVTELTWPIRPAMYVLSPAGATTGSFRDTPSALPTPIVIVWL